MNNPYDKTKEPPTPSSTASSKTGKAGLTPSPSYVASTSSPPGCMGDSISLARQHEKVANYLNQYLREVDKYLPDDIDGVADEHMEGEHLKNFFENFGNWLARTSFETKQKNFLVINPRTSIS